ncbi:MAG TPA: WxL domain-containing protein [Acidimicrobiia bacterium]|nr:WxL domain-containing protein [Acidimicrobiia bacterium]
MSKTKRVVLGLAVATLLTAVFAAPAVADDTTNNNATVTVTAGSLSFDNTLAKPSLGNFTGVTLNGSPQLSSAAMTRFMVNDSTGSGAGWHVDYTLTQFSDGGTHTLASGSVDTKAPVVVADAGTTSPVPTASDALGVDDGAAHKVLSAALNQGMGVYLVSPRPFVLHVPADAYAATYTTTATIDLVTAP